jgi:ferric-dicitrate binding protein FerR (iron transport regulator)
MRRVAAVMIPVLIIAGSTWLLNEEEWKTKEEPILANVEVSVPDDSQKRIVLPDGSQVWVNSSTTIAYNDDFSKERTVMLDGEAFFPVVHDSFLPFRVKTTDMIVSALSTEFNVDSPSDESTVHVLLVKGSVKVETSSKKEVQLVSGEHLTYDTELSEVSVDQIDVDVVAPWRVTNLDMVDMPLSEALERIAIYYGRTLSVTDELSMGVMVDLSYLDRFTVQQVLYVVRDITNNSFDYQLTQDTIKIAPVSQLKV